MRPMNLARIPRDRLLHPEPCVTSAHGMILMGDRRAEEGQDAVAHDPVNGTLVAVNCLNHAVEHRIEELLCSFRVAVRKDLHRVLDIGEQYGDLFALTLDGGPCAQDLIGQVLRSVTPGRDKAAIVPKRLYRMATFGTELGGCWQRASTAAASSRQRSCTLIAELRVNSVLVFAAWTFHSEQVPSRTGYKRNLDVDRQQAQCCPSKMPRTDAPRGNLS